MKQTITANISGIVFHIEIDAYEQLNEYLNTIRSYFKNTEGEDEIMSDIEARIAEIFKAEKSSVISMKEVKLVMEMMGEPEQFLDEDAQSQEQQTADKGRKRKKLYRDMDGNMIGGVCSGLGYYFGIDRIWFRAAFLLAIIFAFGSGILIYLILWIIVPSPANASEKLEMKGEPINVSNIGSTIKEEFDSLKKKVNQKNDGNFLDRIIFLLKKGLQLLLDIFYFLFRFLSKFLALIIFIFSIAALILLLMLSFSGPVEFYVDGLSVQAIEWTDFRDLFFHSKAAFYLFAYGLLLLIGLPIAALLILSFKFLFKLAFPARNFGIAIFSLWVISLFSLLIGMGFTVNHYAAERQVEEAITLESIDTDSLTIGLNDFQSEGSIRLAGLQVDQEKIYHRNLSLEVIPSRSSNYKLRLLKKSRGKNKVMAAAHAKATNINFEYKAEQFLISPYWWTKREEKFHFQEVNLILEVPLGNRIYFMEGSPEFVVKNRSLKNYGNSDLIQHAWQMTADGLICLDCGDEEKIGEF